MIFHVLKDVYVFSANAAFYFGFEFAVHKIGEFGFRHEIRRTVLFRISARVYVGRHQITVIIDVFDKSFFVGFIQFRNRFAL